jgi:hypothetical protein
MIVRGAESGCNLKNAYAEMKRPVVRPVFVAGPARSGTSLLHSILSKASDLWSPYQELHGLYEWEVGLIPDFTEHPNGTSGRDDNVLTEAHATDATREFIRKRLYQSSFNVELLNTTTRSIGLSYHLLRLLSIGWKTLRRAPIRVVDKNPKHCFRIDFLNEIFLDAQFVFLYRRPEANISSLIEGWKSGRYATYEIPESEGCFQWHFDLPPGWENWLEMSLPERCAHQWVGYNQALLRAEDQLPDETAVRCYYEDVVNRPFDVASSLLTFLDVEVSDTVREHCENLPVVNSVSPPDSEKWKKRKRTILNLQSVYGPTAERVGYRPAE